MTEIEPFFKQGYLAYYKGMSTNPYFDFMYPPEWELAWQEGWTTAAIEDSERRENSVFGY